MDHALEAREIAASGCFAADWYRAQYPDVAAAGTDPVRHYLEHGAAEGRDPSPMFSTLGYLSRNPDVAASGMNPFLHYLRHGRSEGRVPSGFTTQQVAQSRPYRTLSEFLRHSLLSPVVAIPFQEADRRCFAAMEAIADDLGARALESAPPGQMLVSVIMPAHNRAPVIAEGIESVLAQRYTTFELIVVDDGSDDDTAAVARRFGTDKRVIVVKVAKRGGASAARNVGLAKAKGDLIAYLDSDNTWLPNYLACMVGALLKLPDAQAAYSGQYIYQADSAEAAAVRFAAYNKSLLTHRNYIDLNCFMHRRSVLDAIGGGFNEKMTRLVDWDLILRVSRSCKMISVPVLQSNYFVARVGNTITANEPLEPALQTLGKVRAPPPPAPEPETGPRLAIIIVSFEALAHLRRCVEEVLRQHPGPQVEVIVVDNHSADPELLDYLVGLQARGMKVLLNTVNYGFSYAVNQGVALADPDADIVLLNNDALPEPGALRHLHAAACAGEDIAMAVPQQVLSAGSPGVQRHVPFASNEAPCDVNLSVHHGNVERVGVFHDGESVELNFAPFFCAYIKREVWDRCGGLDHRNGRHYRSDRIMCETIRHVLGMRIVYTPHAVVHHALQVSTAALAERERGADAYDEMLVRNRWPDDLAEALAIERRPWDF